MFWGAIIYISFTNRILCFFFLSARSTGNSYPLRTTTTRNDETASIKVKQKLDKAAATFQKNSNKTFSHYDFSAVYYLWGHYTFDIYSHTNRIFPVFSCISVVANGLYTFPTVFVQSQRNRPNIHHNGHKYGQNSTKNPSIWFCTKTDADRKRCPASIQTMNVNGISMMRLRNQNHICSNR